MSADTEITISIGLFVGGAILISLWNYRKTKVFPLSSLAMTIIFFLTPVYMVARFTIDRNVTKIMDIPLFVVIIMGEVVALILFVTALEIRDHIKYKKIMSRKISLKSDSKVSTDWAERLYSLLKDARDDVAEVLNDDTQKYGSYKKDRIALQEKLLEEIDLAIAEYEKTRKGES
jgi:hypothetical protein